MRLLVTIIFSATCLVSMAQDEGAVVKKERIQLDKGFFVGGGISIASGSNIGDYSTGINFEGGYAKRLNRVLSLGGSISYLSFKYDESFLNAKPNSAEAFPLNFYHNTLVTFPDDGFILALSGGNISMISLALNLKFNFVPVKDNSVISVYGFAKPFISSTSLSAISGSAEYYYYDATLNDVLRDPSLDRAGTYDSKSSISGGIYIGPGIEYNPAKPISIFAQASFGYTFPLDMVSTRSYGNDYNTDLPNAAFPIKSLGFTSINFSLGISYNLD